MENPPKAPNKLRSPWVLGCGAFLLVLLLVIAGVAAALWWIQRPIRPVVLSPQEQATVEKKIRELEGGTIPLTPASSSVPLSSVPLSSVPLSSVSVGPESAAPAPLPSGTQAASMPASDGSTYVPGTKVLRLTDREVNGLLNQNTDLGNKVRLEFAKDAVNAYLALPIPEDFPVGAGTIFRMRGRFRVSIGGQGQPYAILEDITIFGLSLPKAWLGGIKGENLLGDALGNGGGVLQGVKSLKVEPGALVLEVED